MNRGAGLVLTFACLVPTACGARDAADYLSDPPSQGGGAGGSLITDSGGSPGEAGTGGTKPDSGKVPIECDGMSPTEERTLVGALVLAGQLVGSAEPGGQVKVLASGFSEDSFGCLTQPLLYVYRFDPWGAWSTTPLDSAQQVPFAGFAAAGASAGDQVALLFSSGANSCDGGGMIFVPSLPPQGTWQYTDVGGGFGLGEFVAYQPGEHLIGYQFSEPYPSAYSLHYGRFENGAFDQLTDTGCGTGVRASAIASPAGGFLLATTSALPAGQCPSAGSSEPAHRLQVVSTPTATDWIPWVDLDLNALAELVTVVPLPDGAWILWRSAEPSLSPNPLMGLRVDAKGSPISQPVVLLTPSNGVAYFAFAALGPRLVIGWLDDVAPGGGYNTIRLRAFDPSGVELWTIGYTPKKGFEGGGVTLLGDPSGNHLLMAWTIDFGSWSEDTPRVVRFDCP